MISALNQVAALEDIASPPNVKPLRGELTGWYRLRVGTYRAILKPQEDQGKEIL